MPQPAGRVIDLDPSISGSEVMVEQLQEIAKSMRKLLNGRLTERAIIILLRELLPKGSKVSPKTIGDILKAAASLDEYVVKGPRKERTDG